MACADGLICAKFDDGKSIPAAWTAWGNVTVSDVYAFSGNNSLKVQSSANGGYQSNFLTYSLKSQAALAEKIYGRMMIRVADQSTNKGDFTFILATGPVQSTNPNAAGAKAMYRARLDGSNDHFFANYDTWNAAGTWKTDCWNQPDSPTPANYFIPKNAWACVQWHFDKSTNALEFWLNGNELSQIKVHGTGDGCLNNAEAGVWTAPKTFDEISLGIEQYSATAGARTMYIDDIAIDDKAVPCYGNPVPSKSGPSIANGMTLFGSAAKKCMNCHAGAAATWPQDYSDQESLATKIEKTMPYGEPALCDADCAADIAAYLLDRRKK